MPAPVDVTTNDDAPDARAAAPAPGVVEEVPAPPKRSQRIVAKERTQADAAAKVLADQATLVAAAAAKKGSRPPRKRKGRPPRTPSSKPSPAVAAAAAPTVADVLIVLADESGPPKQRQPNRNAAASSISSPAVAVAAATNGSAGSGSATDESVPVAEPVVERNESVAPGAPVADHPPAPAGPGLDNSTVATGEDGQNPDAPLEAAPLPPVSYPCRFVLLLLRCHFLDT